MVCGRGRPPCVKHGTTNDSVVGRGATNDKEIDLLIKLLKVRLDGYWRSNDSDGKNFGATESYQRHVWELETLSINPHLLERRVVKDIYWAPIVH